MKPKVIVIVGPTASGKTALSIECAKKFNGEVISSDSMQIYKDMNIGTAKVTKEEAQGIKHYLVDFVSPEERYSVSDFRRDAEKALEEIIAKGKTPIVVGGTGLYVNSLIYGIDYQDMEYDKEYRDELMKKAETEEGLKSLYEEALKIDPEAMEKISPNDKKRITRVLEIFKQTGMTKTKQEELSRQNEVKYDYRVFAITMPREELYERINLRVDLMIKDGLIEEVENLLKKYKTFPTAMQGLGYKEVVEYLDGTLTKEEMIDKIKQETRRYAKRQLTWFRRNKEIIWLNKNDGLEKNMEIISEGMK
jgi:tRNA dimethylallyltransferase